MKFNVRGLVFVGFAAAILSGAAAHAGDNDQNIVTSKAFTDATYQTKINGGNDEGKAVIAGSTAGSPTYKTITSDGSNLSTSSTNLVTEGAVATALAAAASSASGDYQTKIGGTNGQVVTSTGTSGQVGFTNVTSTATQNSGDLITSGGVYAEQVLDEKVAHKTGAIVTDSTAEGYNTADNTAYPSAKAVADYVAAELAAQNLLDDTEYQAKVTGNTPMLGTNGSWQQLNSTSNVEVFSGTFGEGADEKQGWGVRIPSAAIADQTSEITGLTANSDSADKDKFATAYAVQQAIAAQAIQTTTDLTGKQDNLGGTITVGNEQVSTAGKVVTATSTAGDVTYTAIDSAVTSGSNNLITSDAVYDALHTGANGEATYQSYSSTAHQISNGAGGWEALDTTINATTAAAGTAPTTGAVKSYVDTQIQAQEAYQIPQKNTSVCTASYPCALVAEDSLLNWRVMAVSADQTTQAGTCGNLGDENCNGTPDANE